MPFLTLLIAFLASGTSAGPAAVAGELCVVRADRTLPDCRASVGRRFAIDASEAPRYLIWWNRDATEAAVGAVGGEAHEIDLQSEAWQPVAIELRGSSDDTIPVVTLTLRTADGGRPAAADHRTKAVGAAATLRVPAHRVASLRRVWVPAREAEMIVAAADHEPVTRAIRRGTTTVGSIVLKALPLLTGTVVAAEDGTALPYVPIAMPSGETAATSDSVGRFTLRVHGDWPEFLRVTAPGRAPADVPVPKIVGSADLGVIRLGIGGALRVNVGDRGPIEVRLLRRTGQVLREVMIRPEVSGSTAFEKLERGSYVVVLRGTGPLQQLAASAEVRDGETTELEPRIDPADLTLEVRRRGEGVAATIAIKPASAEWQTSISTDAEGRYEGEIWQRGEFVSFVTAGETTAVRHDRLDGNERIEWTIDLPHLRIGGTVADRAGKPIAGAEVTLDTAAGGTGIQSAEVTDAAGRFTFRGVEAGQQTLTANADGYVPATLTFALAESDADYNATFRLQRGVRRTLVVTRQGQPAAHATVIDGDGSFAEQRTGSSGTVEITVPAGEHKTLYVLPAEGSFAIVDVDGSGEGTQRIDVPVGAATIRITAVSDEQQPVPAMFFAVRYNGRMLTPWVRAILRNRRGTPLATGSDGVATLEAMPPGVYEIWPYFRADELTRIAAGLVPPRARIAAQAGLSEVRFTFEEEGAPPP